MIQKRILGVHARIFSAISIEFRSNLKIPRYFFENYLWFSYNFLINTFQIFRKIIVVLIFLLWVHTRKPWNLFTILKKNIVLQIILKKFTAQSSKFSNFFRIKILLITSESLLFFSTSSQNFHKVLSEFFWDFF